MATTATSSTGEAVTVPVSDRHVGHVASSTTRVAAIDWMRGFVMMLMIVDHASMAFDASHLDEDSAMYPGAATMLLPSGEFFTRWMTHICAPTFVFLAGVALALSIERRAVGTPLARSRPMRCGILPATPPRSSRCCSRPTARIL
jgi:uncharacterized membrane protein